MNRKSLDHQEIIAYSAFAYFKRICQIFSCIGKFNGPNYGLYNGPYMHTYFEVQ